MVQFDASGERRDDTATDRDDAAVGRDAAATDRDAAATDRDARADDRDDRAGRDAEELRDRLTRMSELLDGPDRAAVRSLFDELRAGIEHAHRERRAAARDRRAAAGDREAADRDRGAAGQDRTDSARDRDQAAIERQQDDCVDRDPEPQDTREGGSLTDRVERAVADSRQRISDSRAYLPRGLGRSRPDG